ncbi:hypothetical protein Ahy_A03g011222 isoform C [Arachis hypogaea]|uniref:Uncharacterized protein n=1 Tax=Arachis hypogaea TaxID=3818 RepID=A0A445DQ22_ARAHY|nr:hypothetical protein Ahy_A03g011222 isoform C [Arachis hypogaea]
MRLTKSRECGGGSVIVYAEEYDTLTSECWLHKAEKEVRNSRDLYSGMASCLATSWGNL